MAEARLRQFKNKGRDDSSMRRRRQEQSVELRKTKRLEALSKRRHVDLVEDGEIANGATDMGTDCAQQNAIATVPHDMPAFHVLPKDKQQGINEALTCLQARVDISPTMVKIRRLVSTSDTIDPIIQSGLLQEVVSVAVESSERQVLEEFSWILTNVTSGTSEQTEEVVNLGCVPVLVTFLTHESLTLQHQSLWALGNIAGNSAVHRDLIASSGVIPYIIQRLQGCDIHTKNNPQERKIAFLAPWVLSNLCRFNNPSPSRQLAEVLVPILVLILGNPSGLFSQTELRDCCWGLSYLTDGYPGEDGVDPLKEMICSDFQLVPVVVGMIQKSSVNNVSILVPCVRFLGNICSGTNAQTMVAINAGILSVAPALLVVGVDRLIIKETIWLLSNCISSSMALVKVIAEAGLMTTIINLMTTASYVVQKECSWAIRNFAMVGSPDMVPYFVDAGGIQAIRHMVTYEDSQIVLNGLEALTSVLRGGGEHLDKISMMVEEAHILDQLELLQCSNNNAVADEAFSITDEFFASEEVPSLKSLNPVETDNQFRFAAPAQMPALEHL
ncbi:importin subunit alpha-1-like [Sycon ciliatum]|uniref:importin subunit alpha-1-like n=1 Tax=Sycon ciliatum TaxID=27933 RepID=UPI0020AE8EE6|eukprot:scpid7530/ scgid18636/ Importin subunit alpha-2; Karyopherin subunit alpha-2